MPSIYKQIIVLVLVLISSRLSSQNANLIAKYKDQVREGSVLEKIEGYNQLGWQYRKLFPDSSIYFLNQSLDLLSQATDQHLKPECLNFLGVAYLYKGEYVNSFDYHQKARDEAILLNDRLQEGHALNSLGRLYEGTAAYDKAIEYYNEALSIFQILDDQIGLAYIYSSLATFYQSQKAFDKAEEMSKKALAIRMNERLWAGVAFSYLELAKIYEDAAKDDLALKILQNAKSFSDSVQANLVLKAEINTEIASLYRRSGDFDQASLLMKDAEEIAEAISNQNLIMKVFNEYGKLNYALKRYKKAINYHNRVADVAQNSAFWAELKEAYLELSKNYDRLGDIKLAYENFKAYNDIEIKFLDTEKARLVQQHDSRLALETREQENKLLKIEQQKNETEIARQELRSTALIGLAVLLFILAASFMYFLYRRNQVNAALLTQKNELGDLNLQKDTLLNIMAHDLRAPFNRILGLIDLMKIDTNNTDQYIDMIDDMSKSGTELIENIMEVNKLESGEFAELTNSMNLKDFLNNKVKDHLPEALAKNIEIKAKVEITNDFTTNELYLERIVDNLLSNAIKYSEPKSDVGIEAKYEDQKLLITISDNGPGFTDQDKKDLYKKFKTLSARPTGGESSNGLGLSLVKTLIDKLEGDISLKSEYGKGSTFEVTIPNMA